MQMPSFTDDILLLRHLKTGDPKAFETFFQKYRMAAMVTAMAILNSEAAAKDLVQEFFADFWQKRLYRHVNHSLHGFVVQAVKNKCINQLSKEDTRRRRIQEITLFDERITWPDNRLEQQELCSEVSGLLQRVLSPVTLKVVQLAYMDGKSRKEIAAEMGTSPNTVRNQLVQGLKILRKNLRRP